MYLKPTVAALLLWVFVQISSAADLAAPFISATESVRGHFEVVIIDTGSNATGLDSIYISNAQNMRTVIPAFVRCTLDTVHMSTDLIDSLRGGELGIHAIDCAGNDQHIALIPRFDPLDTLPPLVVITKTSAFRYTVDISDHRIHDSGLDNSIQPLAFQNFGFSLHGPAKCDTAVLTIPLQVQDIYKNAYFQFRISDCKGNTTEKSVEFFAGSSDVEIPSTESCDIVAVAPNPFNQTTTVTARFSKKREGTPQVHLFSMLGFDVTSWTTRRISIDGENVRATIESGELPAGSYVVVFSKSNESISRRVAVIR